MSGRNSVDTTAQNRKKGTDKWIIEKLNEHDKIIKDLTQNVKQLTKQLEEELEQNSKRIFIDVSDLAEDEEDDEGTEADDS